MALIMFDFDGTIADSFPLALKVYNSLAQKYGSQLLSEQDVGMLRLMNSKELLMHLKIPLLKLPFFVRHFRQSMHDAIGDVKPQQGISHVLRQLKKKGHILVCVTSNTERNVAEFCEFHRIDCFHRIVAGGSIFGKKRLIEKVLKELGVERQNVWYVGDESRDIDAAHSAGVKSVAVGWGYQDLKVLRTFKPTRMVNSPSDLVEVFENA
ncbi:HAD hydrolase-like protein [Candidatus Woesearchaeota archaeon]|nr:HAD hydrolase-like protein [Candidatus Woesearchaeota archaeon]